MSIKTLRLVTRDSDGSIRTRDYDGTDELLQQYEQIGIDDCSTDLNLRGLPIFRGLVGPIPENHGIARYETADVFESLTKEWAKAKIKRRRRRKDTAENALPAVAGLDGMTPGMSNMPLG